MSGLQALLFGLVQGATELFPVSSVGHAVLLPAVLGWRVDQSGPTFLPFIVMLHLGTAAALLVYFRRQWLALLGGALRGGTERKIFWRLVLGTIPAACFGFLFEKRFRALFGAPEVAAAMLVVNALLLFWGERRARRAGSRRVEELTPVQAIGVGFWESTALVPGISRSGATMIGGLGMGLDHEEAAQFSFLLATPVILGAGVLEVPKLLHGGGVGGMLGPALTGGLVAGIAAYVSTAFLMRYFRTSDARALEPFAFYCLVVGVATFVLLHGA